jgi:hypothetical protein
MLYEICFGRHVEIFICSLYSGDLIGVPMWPPRVYLARERAYTKGWHKLLLKQGEADRSETCVVA